MKGGTKSPIQAVWSWVRRQPPKVKAFLAVVSGMAALLVPCVVLAVLIHPSTSHNILNRISWALCVYLEAVSVLPQLRVMQNTKIVEPFTAHYVFALGVARFLSCAHWVLQVVDTRGRLLVALGYGLWPSMVLISEIVQTFILADFCYYYVKSVFGGQLVLRLPSGVV
ncbi:hypothetical protein F2Q70_00033633 [Brassica cretica]|uniref:ER lumen protein-retaining receptor n=1 Tax=Brassica cretica TaxID=69181 RepID=A0A8S9FC88_BRACR|nr:hypothetical protein F2Q70_00033633 [Brassica cretica]